MKKLFSLATFSLLLLFYVLPVSAQSWLWGIDGTGAMKVINYNAAGAVDRSGNVYLVGKYNDKLTFGAFTLNDINDDLFLAKFNPSGVAQWLIQSVLVTANSRSYGTSVTTDSLGYVYITGYFIDTISFNSMKVISNGTFSTFIAKFTPGGNVIWAKQATCASLNSNCSPTSIATDKHGNTYVSGSFQDTIYFGSFMLSQQNYPAQNIYNAFIVKYDSAGNVKWAKQSVTASYSLGSYGAANSVAVDGHGNPFITGFFSDTIHFGADTLIGADFNGSSDGNIFLVKYDTSGNALWARQSATQAGAYAQAYSVIVDKEGNPYIAGNYAASICFGADTLKSGEQMYLVKYNVQGNLIWAHQSSIGTWSGVSLAKDGHDNIYLGGAGKGDSIIFGGATIRNMAGGRRASMGLAVLLKIDTSGKTECGSILSNASGGIGYSECIASDSSGNYVYMAGTFSNDSLFCGSDTLIAATGEYPYLARWEACNTSTGIMNPKPLNQKLSVFPNPFHNSTTVLVNTEGKHYLQLYDISGRELQTVEFTGRQYELSSQGLAQGMYFIRVLDGTNAAIGTSKIVVQ